MFFLFNAAAQAKMIESNLPIQLKYKA